MYLLPISILRLANPRTVVELSSRDGRISVEVRGREIFYEAPPWVNPSADFAVWVALPIAMRFGGVMRVNGPTSAEARRNAERLSLIWSTWLPHTFRPVRVESEDIGEPRGNSGKALMLYSGGVDSTYSLRRYVMEGNEKPDLVTIHGHDYRRHDFDRFEQLLAKTSAFRATFANDSYQVRSNAPSILRRMGVPSAIGHGFRLFATLFLFDETHSTGLIAADFTREQDYLSLPWGTNALTNPLFAGGRMAIRGLHDDVSRGRKAAALAGDDLALRTISFCKDYSVRPENCGVCSKCVRTKAMFHAAGHDVPDIFLIPGFRVDDLRFIDVSKPIEIAFCLDILDLARASGRESEFRVLEDLLFRGSHSKVAPLLRRIEGAMRARSERNRVAASSGA